MYKLGQWLADIPPSSFETGTWTKMADLTRISYLDGYQYADANHTAAHGYLLPAIGRILSTPMPSNGNHRIFELGYGNGSVANLLNTLGYEVVGIDPSVEGIA